MMGVGFAHPGVWAESGRLSGKDDSLPDGNGRRSRTAPELNAAAPAAVPEPDRLGFAAADLVASSYAAWGPRCGFEYGSPACGRCVPRRSAASGVLAQGRAAPRGAPGGRP